MTDYIVATIKPWNIAAFHRRTPMLPGRWHLITEPAALDTDALAALKPRYLFFPHWSWRVPADIVERFECVSFHMTDLPYGRGGSPLQNLIARGHEDTQVSALRMVEALDAGPIYLKRPASLAGRAQDIFERVADLIYDMIAEIVEKEPKPVPQSGPVTTFARRAPEQGRLPESGPVRAIYDHIRMLDAETYPSAFLDYGEYRLEFSHAELDDGDVGARVMIRQRKERNES